ncbi:hypothetical protein [Lentzea sp. NBRC 105346]|uniref:hypothetical protein n=1 Tax=Lentzea sp. NBRC 105346 TaxID=3032205 RepID=UPI0025530119|nr:hypothetical protein [Lentzea sp. NBRC 105346]
MARSRAGTCAPGRGADPADSAEMVLLADLYLDEPAADCCTFTGSPDARLRLPDRDYWA